MGAFIKTELRLLKSEFNQPDVTLPSLYGVDEIKEPTYKQYRELHDRVGKPYNWHLRNRIANEPEITELIQKAENQTFTFYRDNKIVGYAFNDFSENPKTPEISDFGFFPELTGEGLGKIFFPWVLKKTFEREIDYAWLTTRSTNHPKVIKFYQSFGFKTADETQCIDDTEE